MAKNVGAPSPKPSDLSGPIPGGAEMDELDAFLNEASAPDMGAMKAQAAPQEAPMDELDSFLSQSGGGMPQTPMGVALSPGELPADASPFPAPEGWDAAKEQFREATTRFKASFAVSSPEAMDTLRKSGLFEDVRKGKGGVIEVKRPGRKGWERFDRQQIELLGDALDLSRTLFEGVIEAGGEAVGTVALSLMGMNPVIANAVSGAGSAVLAKKTGDWVAQDVLGIPLDPKRDIPSETKVAAGMGAIFGTFGAARARAKGAKELRTEGAQKQADRFRNQIEETTQQIKDVKDSGIVINGGEFRMDAQQMGKDIPHAKAKAELIADQPGFQEFRVKQGEQIEGAFDNVITTMKGNARAGGASGADVVLTADTIRATEGRLIGDYRKFAKQELVGQPLPAPRSQELVMNIVNMDDKLMVDQATGLIKVKPGEVIAELTERQQEAYLVQVNKYFNAVRKNGGQMDIDSAKELYDSLTREINKNMKSGQNREYAFKLIEMKNAIRDDWTDMMGQVLPDDMLKEYATSKESYSQIMGAFDVLRNELKTENISMEAFANQIFGKGKQNLNKTRSLKALLIDRDPQLWRDITSQYMNSMLNNASTKDGINYNKLWKDWVGLGKEMRAEIMSGSGIDEKGVTAMIQLGKKYQNNKVVFKPTEGDVRKIVDVASMFMRVSDIARKQIVERFFGSMGKDEAVKGWLADGGIELVEKELKKLGANPSQLKKFSNGLWDFAEKTVTKPGRTVIRREMEDKKKQ